MFVGLVTMVFVAVGCSDARMHEVEGTVTLDGKDLREGDIVFTPEDTKLGPDAGKIKDGKYKFKAKPGKMKVQILATREVPGKKGPMGTEPLLEDIIADEYNAKTTLTADVGPGKTKFDFQLKKK
jgi:hypothetical protein